MGKLSRGITFQTNSRVTQAMLHALVDSATAAADAFPGTPTLYDIVMGDLSTIRAFGQENSPSSPATNDLTVGSDGYLDRYDGSGWVDLTTDYRYLLNGSAITLATGNPVTGDPSSVANCKLWAGPATCYEPLGVCQTVAAPGATASIAVRGFAVARINNPLAVGVNSHLSIQAAGATGLTLSTSSRSDVLGIVVQTDTANPTSGYCLMAITH